MKIFEEAIAVFSFTSLQNAISVNKVLRRHGYLFEELERYVKEKIDADDIPKVTKKSTKKASKGGCSSCREKKVKHPYCYSCKIPMYKKDDKWICSKCGFWGKVLDKE